MTYEARKKFRVAGVDYAPGDLVDPAGWRNRDVLERNGYIRHAEDGGAASETSPAHVRRGKGNRNAESTQPR